MRRRSLAAVGRGSGALAGFIGLIRWQNVLFALLPAIEALVALWRASRAGDDRVAPRDARRRRRLHRLRGRRLPAADARVEGDLRHYLAVSPVGPQIRWRHPHLVDILWSSRNGLFSWSPILYVGAIGLVDLRAPATGGRRARRSSRSP